MFNKSPIFIFGNRRSGTTLLRLMLTSHQNIAIPPEGDFLIQLGWKYDSRRLNRDVIENFIEDLYEMQNIQDWEIDRDSLRERLLDSLPNSFPMLVNEIYQEYNRIKFTGSKKRWGDKTTWYSNYIPQIRKYYPDMKVIHIVRDVRAVVASYQNVPHLPNDVRESTMDWLWTAYIINRARHLFSPGQWFQIRYEDLVEDPMNELKKICAFLDEPFQEGMLNYWKQNRENNLEPSRHLDWKMKTLEKVTTNQTDQWKTTLSEDDQVMIAQHSRIVMRKYGYPIPEIQVSLPEEFSWTLFQKRLFFIRNIVRLLKEAKARVQTLLRIN